MRFFPTLATGLLIAPQAMAEAPQVVTDIAPVHALVKQVMAGVGTPELLLPATADPHHFHMRPSQSRLLQNADILFWVGEDMTPWLAEVVEQTKKGSRQVELLFVEGTHTRAFDGDHDDEAHGAEHDDDNDADHGETTAEPDHHDAEQHDRDHGETDPHAWLDPNNAIVWLQEMAHELGKLDPDNAALYAENAKAEAERITAATAQARALLKTNANVPVLFLHDAFAYFSEAFGLNVLGAVQDGDAATPGAARLRDLKQDIAKAGTVCVFPEEGQSDKYLNTVIEGSAARIGATLNPLGVSDDTGYPGLITRTAAAIANCTSGL